MGQHGQGAAEDLSEEAGQEVMGIAMLASPAMVDALEGGRAVNVTTVPAPEEHSTP